MEQTKKNVEIDIFKEHFSETDIPGIVLFRTENINDEILYYQNDPRKNKKLISGSKKLQLNQNLIWILKMKLMRMKIYIIIPY